MRQNSEKGKSSRVMVRKRWKASQQAPKTWSMDASCGTKDPTSVISSLTSSSKQEWLFLVVGESEKDRGGAAIPHKRWPEHRWSDWLDLASEINHDLDGCDLRLATCSPRSSQHLSLRQAAHVAGRNNVMDFLKSCWTNLQAVVC